MAERYMFGGFCVDEEQRRLLDPSGGERPLKPTAFRVLLLLLEAAPYTVERPKFYKRVWEGDKASPKSLSARLDQSIAQIRSALKNDAQREFVKVARGSGFAFDAEVRKASNLVALIPEGPMTATSGGLVLSTKRINPQWADFAMYVVPPAPWRLQCQISTDSPYFRFGFKLLGKSARVFGDGSVQSDNDNFVVHIGRNYWNRPGITKRDLFLTAYMNGRRLNSDAKLKRVPTTARLKIQLALDGEHFARFFVDDELQFSQILLPSFCEQVALLAWGDQDEFRVDVTELSLKPMGQL